MAPSFDCCTKASFHSGQPLGVEDKVGDLRTYVTGANTSDKAILIITDVHGLSLLNVKLVADKLAQSVGARVYVPDFFDGEDTLAELAKNPGKDRTEIVKAQVTKYSPRNFAPILASLDAIRKAQPSVKKVGSVGYCWGGPGAVHVATAAAGANQVDAAAFAHPSLLEVDDLTRLQRPLLALFAQHDGMFPADKQAEAKKVLEELGAKEGVFSRVSYYPNTTHGWALKADEKDAYATKAMANAVTELIGFFSQELAT